MCPAFSGTVIQKIEQILMPEKKFGLVQIFWGNGKGKTTAAMGTAFRALGRGYKVHLVQVMKSGIAGTQSFDEYGELLAAKNFENFSVERFGFPEWVIGKPKKEHILEARKGLESAKKTVQSGKFDIVVFDECLYAVQMGLLKEEDIIELIKSKAKNTELILTGSHKPLEKIFEQADLVTKMKKTKHQFDKGISARIGIEF